MPNFAEKPTIITLHVRVLPEAKAAFVDWQAKFNSKMLFFPGFVSLEFLSSPEKQGNWVIVQRFSSEEKSRTWLNSQERKELIRELQSLAEKNGIQEKEEEVSCIPSSVTEVIITKVNPGRIEEYRLWSAKIHQVEAHFPGFRGTYVQSPQKEDDGHWITLLQFDSMEHLDNWLNSSERQALLEESAPYISSLETNRMISPYEGWFASIAKTGEIPSVWKQTMIVLLVLFPIVMFELKYLSPLLTHFNSSLSTFIGNAISVTLISFPMMPIAIFFLGWWLLPKGQKKRKTLAGTCLILLLYLVEIAFFWNFF